MFRRLFRATFSLACLAVLALGGMALVLICDGSADQGDHADLAMVPGHGEVAGGQPSPALKARLDRAVQLYQQQEVPLILLCGGTAPDGTDEAAVMGQYLQDHGVPGSALVEDHQGGSTDLAARHAAEFMKARGVDSVLVITQYYHITRVKLALRHVGITQIAQAHVGKLRTEDAREILREAVATYYDAAKFYFLPVAKVAAQQLEDEAEKVKSQAKDKINSIDK
ncbi:MAG TPA: YdcF family protein [Candidatus Methylacidiphilales bacterium]|nr:YdcF family protein [Candidatus Methylacidiphilales bacterium]